MKKIIAMVCLTGLTSLTEASLIAGWNFNSQTSSTPAPTPISADHGSGSLDLSQLANSADATIGGSGTAQNEYAGDTAVNDLIVTAGSSQRENGKSLVLSFSTSGYQNIILTYATDASGTGFNSQQWSYSTDGVNYTPFATVTGMMTTYTLTGTETVNFSSTTDVNNVATVYFELTLNGASGSGGTDHFDNIQFNGDIIPVPEPPMWGVIYGAGALAFCGIKIWRQQRVRRVSR